MNNSKGKKSGKDFFILIVEDNPKNQEVIVKMLSKENYKIALASNGEQALGLIEMTPPDLILLDIVMPGMNGFEVCQKIKSDPKTKDIPIIFLTAMCATTDVVRGYELGASDYITKPIYPKELIARIKFALQNTQLQLDKRRQENIIEIQSEKIKTLEHKIEQLSKDRWSKKEKEELEKYRIICGEMAHSIKGEFLNIGYANNQIMELSGNSPDILEECDIIERSMSFSRIILQQLLDYLDIGEAKIEPINMMELFKKTELLAKPRLKKNINFNISIVPETKETIVSGNFEQLLGVILGLINNASNAMQDTGGTIDVRMEKNNNEIAVAVSDNGPGIPDKIKEKIFHQQVDSQSGLGLGLYLSNKIVHYLGGKLVLKNSSPQGTKFLILLPAASNKEE